jgi:hypothetical protein
VLVLVQLLCGLGAGERGGLQGSIGAPMRCCHTALQLSLYCAVITTTAAPVATALLCSFTTLHEDITQLCSCHAIVSYKLPHHSVLMLITIYFVVYPTDAS